MVETPSVVGGWYYIRHISRYDRGEYLVHLDSTEFYAKTESVDCWKKYYTSYINKITDLEVYADNGAVVEEIDFDQFFQDHIEDFL